MRTSVLGFVLAGAVVASAGAQQDAPLSAIDWLSRSIEAPEASDNALPGDVTVAPLDEPLKAAGTMSPAAAGLPEQLWHGSSQHDLIRLIEALPSDVPPALRGTVIDMMLAAAAPPDADENFLFARIDRLLAMGRLEDARALIEAAGPLTPGLFRRLFDVALLTGTEDAACAELEARPEIAPTYPARIFCLARGGDWPAAALTLETAQALDALDAGEQVIMARFLDDGESDLLPPPVGTERVTPLHFRIYEAIGEPLPTRPLPLAFAHADLRAQLGWKRQIEAAERLARAGALPADGLLDLYTSRSPAASGGVWERAEAAAALVEALEEGDARPVAAAALAAWQAFAAAGLEHVYADLWAERLNELPLQGEAARLAETALLLAGRGSAEDAVDRAASLVGNARTERVETVRRGLERAEPRSVDAELLLDSRTGEAILSALGRAGSAWEGGADDMAALLATLRAAGLEEAANRTAAAFVVAPKP
ncbi:hypothetical protein [Roseitranquillus sediminis]|uniref:hypothetical protein n=1 Tax=Roseitranquillus sediminis TaxID=2809051 RepID=UPI001D0C92CB|nr:hypothetical protein [Roseitranquillus sediminis]MBM9595586.1 hypothetical protein [Roseitranquillus sediminis]